MLSNILVDILAVIAEKCVSSSTEGLKQEKNLKTETSSEHRNAVLNSNSFFCFSQAFIISPQSATAGF